MREGKRCLPRAGAHPAARLGAVLLAVALLMNLGPTLPLSAWAEGVSACPRHPEHTAVCGYQEAVEAQACTYVHVHDAACGYQEAAEGVAAQPCTDSHTHDATCGYQEAAAGTDCTHSCFVCQPETPDAGFNPPNERPGAGPPMMLLPADEPVAVDGNVTELLENAIKLDSQGNATADKAFSVTVKQGEILFTGAQDEKLNWETPISVTVNFRVPVLADSDIDVDDATTYVVKENYAEFDLALGLEMTNPASMVLEHSGTKVGDLTFISTGSGDQKTTKARIDFNGADQVFDGTKQMVSCTFHVELKYGGGNTVDNIGDKLVEIMGKEFKVYVPGPEKIYGIEKEDGVIDPNAPRIVTWTVRVTGTQGGQNISLDGLTFSDTLPGQVEYVSDSFQVDNNPVADKDVYDTNAKELVRINLRYL